MIKTKAVRGATGRGRGRSKGQRNQMAALVWEATNLFTVIGLGQFQWQFSVSDMSDLWPGTYNTGMTVANADQTQQFSVGPLPIVDGIVP